MFFGLAGKFDDQDGVLRRQTNKHDKPDLRQDVDRRTDEKQSGHRCEQTHRHDQDNGEREPPAFILAGEDKEHKKSSSAEDQKRRRSFLLLLIGKIGPLEAYARR